MNKVIRSSNGPKFDSIEIVRADAPPANCPHGYFDEKNCRRCRQANAPMVRCRYCGTNGDHYCPADVARD